MAQSPESRLRTQRAKHEIVKILNGLGEVVWASERTRTIQAILSRRGFSLRRVGEPTCEYFERIARMAPQPKEEYVGEVVEAFVVDRMARRDYEPEPHLRAAEIDALPRPVSMPWDGTEVRW